MTDIRQRAKTFNANAAIYDGVRPGYPDQLYQDLQTVANISETTAILEIGAGNGIATHEMAACWKAEITAVEPGAELLAIAQERCRQHPRVHFVHSTFEEFTAEERFDLIVVATAFHWLDPALKFTKTAKFLKDNGILAVFWNNYSRDDSPVFDEFQTAYERFHPTLSGVRDIKPFMRQKIQKRLDEMQSTPLFRMIAHKEYNVTIPLTTNGYLNLLKTFSDNAVLPPKEIAPFYQEIERILGLHGHAINLPILTDLTVLQKIAGSAGIPAG
jgi:trans-aconitate methyltransferase